jgi:hypothetical protein
MEALNSETIANAVGRLVAMNVLREMKTEGSLLTLDLAYEFSSTFFQSDSFETLRLTELWKLTEKVGSFRREGKHRRDNDSTGIRVLRLAKLKRQKLHADSHIQWKLGKPKDHITAHI